MRCGGSSVRGVLEYQARGQATTDFVIAPETGRRLSFGDLLRSSRALAAFLAAQGIAAGAHVGLLLPNGLQAVRLFVGVVAGGRVLVPLSLIAQPAQLAFILDHSDCQAVFLSPEREEALRAARIAYRVVDEYGGDTLSGRAARTSVRPLTLEELADFFLGAWSLFEVLDCNFEDGTLADRLGFFDGESAYYADFDLLLRQKVAARFRDQCSNDDDAPQEDDACPDSDNQPTEAP